jgi:hypothetical protein
MCVSPHPKTETHPVSETLCSLVFIIQENELGPESNSECYTPSAESYRIFSILAVQQLTGSILKRNCNVYMLLICHYATSLNMQELN